MFFDESPQVFERHRKMNKMPDPYELPYDPNEASIMGATYIAKLQEAH